MSPSLPEALAPMGGVFSSENHPQLPSGSRCPRAGIGAGAWRRLWLSPRRTGGLEGLRSGDLCRAGGYWLHRTQPMKPSELEGWG